MIDLTKLPSRFEDCTDEQKKFFDNIVKHAKNRLIAATTEKCWLCKQKYTKPLYDLGDKKRWNYPFLVHLKATHGLDPEMIEDMILS
jgi:hypothetical protein